ncbi:flagellar biosynthesis regulator FlaF [Rubellimicrobium rubrum]|uniref:Flagellar biosynthesis regulator FlaF n=1 Tax=Rubellimicrobium rubrum TaxID=2585369 RepID=A0A5C4N4M6_9RHOB|nr:flagellar biosynthesis regulator FlaF [Rubellimicrobium rubrum]TNC51556.1 flagellar biosynthesis regulator FlaF [Rubellimicrobium rubrum]
MNAMQQARNAYAGPQSPIRTPRQTEHQVFSTVTARLAAAAQRPEDFSGTVAALHDNRRLWTFVAAQVAGKDNALPQDLRARLFYLAEFTDHHTNRVLNREADLQPLIDINTAVMRGLGAMPAPAATPKGPQ